MSLAGKEEKRFLAALEALFTGADTDGAPESGFINLMHIKREYFKSVQKSLLSAIDARARDRETREELFGKLHTFFERHFCESGSIYFRHLRAFDKVYERVYEDGRDIALAWKTKGLYYVKSDTLVKSMPVSFEGEDGGALRFYFDAGDFRQKKNNEKREFLFTFDKVTRGKNGNGNGAAPVLHLKADYARNGGKTKNDEILKAARKSGMSLNEDDLNRAFQVFRRQTEADFFINKDARAFLREQFDMYLYGYIFGEKTAFTAGRIKQLQAIQETAYDIIDFIAQFEDELRRAWEKPKFVRNTNYVVTLDRLSDALVKRLTKHAGMQAQIEEWRELGIAGEKFTAKQLTNALVNNGDHAHMPLDTKYFKDMEPDILAALGDLDEAMDGELVHSENWQALNTLQARYKGRVKCIYIDPPFNLDSSDQFDYRTNYKDSCWATMLENRISLGRQFLADDGAIFVRCDYNGNWIVRQLMDEIMGADNFKNEVIVNRTQEFFKSPPPKQRKLMNDIDSLLVSGKSDAAVLNRIRIKRTDMQWQQPFLPGRGDFSPEKTVRTIAGTKFQAPKGRIWGMKQDDVDEYVRNGRLRIKTAAGDYLSPDEYQSAGRNQGGQVEYAPKWRNIKNNWTDIPGYSRTWGFDTSNAEELLSRATTCSTAPANLCLDFFAGSGTTLAVAHKQDRKWLGVEMGEHFHTVILPRMKKVLAYDKSGISKEIPEYKGGGAFKYYSLEQYEETLKNSRYQSGEQMGLDSTKTPFQQYVFFCDDKLTQAVKSLKKKADLQINLYNLYPDMDFAATLANVLGKPIRRQTADTVTFADGKSEKINPSKMTQAEQIRFITLIKPCLWWGNR